MTVLRQLAWTIVLIATFVVASGCSGQAVGVSPTPSGGIGGTATAGPTCPVEKVPADPACAARPVAGAGLVVRDGSGHEIARVMTGVDGTFFVPLPAGSYVVAPQPVEGLMGTAPEENVDVAAGARSDVTLVYDTGIRGPIHAP